MALIKGGGTQKKTTTTKQKTATTQQKAPATQQTQAQAVLTRKEQQIQPQVTTKTPVQQQAQAVLTRKEAQLAPRVKPGPAEPAKLALRHLAYKDQNRISTSAGKGAQPYRQGPNPLVEFAAGSTQHALAEAKRKYGTHVVRGVKAGSSGKGSGGATRVTSRSGGGGQRSGSAGGGGGGSAAAPGPQQPPGPSAGEPQFPEGRNLEEELWKQQAEEERAELERRLQETERQFKEQSEQLEEETEAAKTQNKFEMAARGLLNSTLRTDALARLHETKLKALQKLLEQKNLTADDIKRTMERVQRQATDKVNASRLSREWQVALQKLGYQQDVGKMKYGTELDIWKEKQMTPIELQRQEALLKLQQKYAPKSSGGSVRRSSSQSKPPFKSRVDALKYLERLDRDYKAGKIPGPVRGRGYREVGAVYPDLVKNIPRIIPEKKQTKKTIDIAAIEKRGKRLKK